MQSKQMTYDGKTVTVAVTEAMVEVLDAVNAAGRGRFAYVQNHVSASGYTVPCISHMWMLALPHYDRYLARIRGEVAAMEATAVAEHMHDWETYRAAVVAAGLSPDQLFADSKAIVLARLAGEDDSTAAQREGHVNCYAHDGQARIHLLTVKDPDTKRQVPVIGMDGLMVADSAMLPFYQIRRYPVQAGVRKPVKSAVDTVMRETIKHIAHKRQGVAHWKGLSLQKGNFQFVTLDSARIFGLVRDRETAVLDAAFAEAYRDIGNLPRDPLSTLAYDAQCVPVSAPVPVR